jgi:hypothetical protein
MTAEKRRVFQTISDNLSKSAHEMPENLYTFRPEEGLPASFRTAVIRTLIEIGPSL